MAMDLYVSPRGDDRWTGRRAEADAQAADGPVATLAAARDRLRAADARAGATIHLRGGAYHLDASLMLDATDSGSADAPVTWRACEGEQVRLIGGRRVEGFEPVTDQAILSRLPAAARGHVLCADLQAQGITDFGTYHPRGHGGGTNVAALELFFNGEVMTLARWPHAAPLPGRGFTSIAEVDGDGIVYAEDRPAQWAKCDDLYVHGYLSRDWASTIARVTTHDPRRRRIELDPPRGGHYGVNKGGRFYFRNVLEELAHPGDWAFDRAAGMLYFWPPTPIDTGEAIVSMLESPLIDCRDVEHVRFERLTIECARGDGVSITGGRDVSLLGCTLRNIGRAAVRIAGGFDHHVTSCDIHHTGESGIDIDAGDAVTLTPCHHHVHNCHLHHIAREGWTYFGALNFRGVGAIATHNRVHDHPHALAFFWGNEFRFEFNEFYNATLEGDDCGIMYMGRRFEWQGNVIRHNWFHHVGDSGRNEWGSSGVYMDDGAGGTEIRGNVFQLVNKGVLAGGGINTRVVNNIFLHCRPAVWFDERCASARADRGETMIHGFMKDHFYAVNAHQPPYSDRYPLMDMVHDRLQRGVGVQARNCAVTNNIIVGSGGKWLSTSWAALPDYFDCRDNMIEQDPHFVDQPFGDLSLRDDSPAYERIGFEPIPFERIGLVRDDYRTAIEDVRTAIEIVRPVGADGTPGLARLRLRNVGDVDVQGVELIDLKLQRHGPGIAYVQAPFAVRAGEETSVEFEVRLAAATLKGVYEVFLWTRGERVRPVWTTMPVAYEIACELEALGAVTAGGEPTQVRLTARNVSKAPVDALLLLHCEPTEDATVTPGRIALSGLPAGASEDAHLSVAVPLSDELVSRVTVHADGEGVKPAALPLIVEYDIATIDATADPASLPQRMSAVRALPVARVPHRSSGGHIADLRLAVSGDALAVFVRVEDRAISLTEMLWDGSSIELFACSPDRERIGHVFGNIPIGHVFLTPADGVQPARGYITEGNDAKPHDDIRVTSHPEADGYTLGALVPMRLLALEPAMSRFLFEAQITTGFAKQQKQQRATLFGSDAAYQDATSFALARI